MNSPQPHDPNAHPGAHPHAQPYAGAPNAQHAGVYRAPQAGGAFPAMSGTLRIVFMLVVSVMALFFVMTVGFWTAALIIGANAGSGAPPDETFLGIGTIAMLLLVLLLYVQIGVGIGWLYKAWSWLPWDQRYTKHWRSWLNPGQVALMMFIPYFHYYWMFVANCGLCDALDRLRVTYPTRDPAPKNLAIAACICQLVVPFPVGAFLWLLFMTRVERMTKEMSAGMGQRMHQAY